MRKSAAILLATALTALLLGGLAYATAQATSKVGTEFMPAGVSVDSSSTHRGSSDSTSSSTASSSTESSSTASSSTESSPAGGHGLDDPATHDLFDDRGVHSLSSSSSDDSFSSSSTHSSSEPFDDKGGLRSSPPDPTSSPADDHGRGRRKD